MAIENILHPRTGAVIGTRYVEPSQTPTYASYTYAEFTEKLINVGAAEALITAKNAGGLLGANVELFMELIKANDLVDFNLARPRVRLQSVVPTLITAEQADAILYNTAVEAP